MCREIGGEEDGVRWRMKVIWLRRLNVCKMFSCVRVGILGYMVMMVLVEVVVLVRVVEVMCLGAYFLSGVEVGCLRVDF